MSILGEAATTFLKDHEAIVDRHSEVPGRSMKGMRNRIAHGHFDIDLVIVREAERSALPALLAQWPRIRAVLDQENQGRRG